MVLIGIRMRLARDHHEARTVLVEPCVHGLIKTREPRRSGCRRHVIPGINQLPDVMELIFKLSRGRLVGVPDGLVNCIETGIAHHIIEPEGGSVKLLISLDLHQRFTGLIPT